ncbi:MAG: serine hydrolase, partial [Halieaceae bacterium]
MIADRHFRLRLFGLAIACGLLYGTALLRSTATIGAGYAAKQICSGVFVARLSEQFVVNADVLPRLATVGPLAELLGYEVDYKQREVLARMLGQKVTAQYREGYGCTLNQTDHPPLFTFVAAADDVSKQLHGTEVASTPIANAVPAARAGSKPALQTALDTAFMEPADGGRNTLAVIVMHRGEMVAERYGAPVTAATPMQGWSMNKSLMATFIGRQVDQVNLDLDGAVMSALQAAGTDSRILGKVNPSLTLRHLLSMTTGFDFSERYFPGDDVTDMLYRQPGMWRSAPDAGHAHPPGVQWAYSSGDINTASLMWQQSLNGEPYPDWINTNFSRPLALQEVVLEPDA